VKVSNMLSYNTVVVVTGVKVFIVSDLGQGMLAEGEG
jgi:hypothetical protein